MFTLSTVRFQRLSFSGVAWLIYQCTIFAIRFCFYIVEACLSGFGIDNHEIYQAVTTQVVKDVPALFN